MPVSAAITSATTAVPIVSPTHTVTPIITATAIATTVKTTATTVPVTVTSTTQPPRGYIAAGFSGDILEGPAPLAVQFTDQSSGGPDTWSWSFGDGSTGTAQNPSHTYLYPGTYSVTLTVRNPSGATDTFFEDSYITVNNPVTVTGTVTTQTTTLAVDNTVTTGFSGTPVTGTSPLNVVFTDSSTGSPSSWYWDFGDGTQSTVENPSHTYTVPGTYTVSLTATGSGGTKVRKLTNYITVTNLSTPVSTLTPLPVTSNGYPGAVQTAAAHPMISLQPTPVTPRAPTDQAGELEVIYFIIIGIIATIAVVAVILYKGAGTGNRLDK